MYMEREIADLVFAEKEEQEEEKEEEQKEEEEKEKEEAKEAKEEKEAKETETVSKTASRSAVKKLRLLDVGSCFDPFTRFAAFDSLAIDISPAAEGVVEMDFILASVAKEDSSHCRALPPPSPPPKLYQKSFHIVVFSLLLEYFPSPRHRWICCLKANRVLKKDGVLVIVTPDSSHVNKRAAQMKSWQKALETHLGFDRWKYEKLTHLHCMIFRKVEDVDNSKSIEDFAEFYSLLFIPQDHNQSGTKPVELASTP